MLSEFILFVHSEIFKPIHKNCTYTNLYIGQGISVNLLFFSFVKSIKISKSIRLLHNLCSWPGYLRYCFIQTIIHIAYCNTWAYLSMHVSPLPACLSRILLLFLFHRFLRGVLFPYLFPPECVLYNWFVLLSLSRAWFGTWVLYHGRKVCLHAPANRYNSFDNVFGFLDIFTVVILLQQKNVYE